MVGGRLVIGGVPASVVDGVVLPPPTALVVSFACRSYARPDSESLTDQELDPDVCAEVTRKGLDAKRATLDDSQSISLGGDELVSASGADGTTAELFGTEKPELSVAMTVTAVATADPPLLVAPSPVGVATNTPLVSLGPVAESPEETREPLGSAVLHLDQSELFPADRFCGNPPVQLAGTESDEEPLFKATLPALATALQVVAWKLLTSAVGSRGPGVSLGSIWTAVDT